MDKAIKVPQVYEAISSVSAAISKTGITKERENQHQKYKFRGIDDVYNAMAPLLAESGLCILPMVLERHVVERKNSNGTALFYVTVKVDYSFVSSKDGSVHHVFTYGEAMDSGDKATNKAMSAAYKYACMQAFCIPTEGDNDADGSTHTVKAEEKQECPFGGDSDKRKAWLAQAVEFVGKLNTADEIKKWSIANRHFVDALGAKQLEYLSKKIKDRSDELFNNSLGSEEIPF